MLSGRDMYLMVPDIITVQEEADDDLVALDFCVAISIIYII